MQRRCVYLISAFASDSGILSEYRSNGINKLINFLGKILPAYSSCELNSILCDEQIKFISGLEIANGHVNKYNKLIRDVEKWRIRESYARKPGNLYLEKYKLPPKALNLIRDRLASIQAYSVSFSRSAGYATLNFMFESLWFGRFRGEIEIRTKYAGDTRFSIAGGYKYSGGTYLLADSVDLTGEIHCHKMGLDVFPEMKFSLGEENWELCANRLMETIVFLCETLRSECTETAIT